MKTINELSFKTLNGATCSSEIDSSNISANAGYLYLNRIDGDGNVVIREMNALTTPTLFGSTWGGAAVYNIEEYGWDKTWTGGGVAAAAEGNSIPTLRAVTGFSSPTLIYSGTEYSIARDQTLNIKSYIIRSDDTTYPVKITTNTMTLSNFEFRFTLVNGIITLISGIGWTKSQISSMVFDTYVTDIRTVSERGHKIYRVLH